ncbi:unnamed protein product [Staurois parvus]|uniref:Uncharacterized protein n=1 Tax=Staurois parvus TaxID=386267 RepID=A0ABN9DB54_9NEOB|nr:unnamed protein product [Staurois parvus]
MPASGFRVPVPVTSAANLKIFQKLHFFKKRLLHTFHIHFVPTALSCALPAF